MVTLTEIITAISNQIRSITEATGYTLNFGDINDPTPASYPAALITFAKQAADNSQPAMQRGFVNTEIQIKLMTNESSVTDNDTALDNALKALKDAFTIGNGYYAFDDEAILTYMGFEKDIAANGDVFSPGYLITKWNVLHRE